MRLADLRAALDRVSTDCDEYEVCTLSSHSGDVIAVIPDYPARALKDTTPVANVLLIKEAGIE